MPEVCTVDSVLTALLPDIEPEEVEKCALCGEISPAPVISLDVTFWAMEELILAGLAAMSDAPLVVLAGAGVELWEPETGLVGLIAELVSACALLPGSDDVIGEADAHPGVWIT